MITEAPAAIASLAESADKLRSDLDNIQRELDQALSVWRSTLVAEKRDVQQALDARESAWQNREADWQRQKESYERRLQQAEEGFRTRLSAVEMNALRALNELDDVWQRDRLAWSKHANERIRELESREAAWREERQRQENEIHQLQSRVQELENAGRAAATESSRLTHAAAAAEQSRALLEQSLEHGLRQLSEREAFWQADRRGTEAFIRRLQERLDGLQDALSAMEGAARTPVAVTELLLTSIESEIDVLGDILRLCGVASPSASGFQTPGKI